MPTPRPPVDRDALVVLRTGEPPPPVEAARGGFASYIAAALAPAWGGPVVEFDLRAEAPTDALAGAAALVITGSSSSVTERAPWMVRAEAFLAGAVAGGAAVLGICFGHQLLARALGGEVKRNPRGREMGTVLARASADDPLFAGLGPEFRVNASHVDAVATLPPGARPLASTALDDFAAFAFGPRARAVQFHPEFDGDVMRRYLEARRPVLEAEGRPVDAMLAGAADTPAGPRLMQNFVRAFVLGPAGR